MGNVTGILADQKAEIVAALRADYDEGIAAGKPDAELQAALQKKYLAMEANMKKRNTPTTKPSGKFQRRPTQVGQGAKKGGGKRRRSYGEDTSPVRSQVASSSMVESASAPVLPADSSSSSDQNILTDPDNTEKVLVPITNQNEKAQDNWDSVVEQPRCAICNMVFQTQTKLDRHIKYSSSHAAEVKKQEQAAAAATAEPVIVEVPPGIEGVDYKMLYSGIKYYWRSKTDIEFHIYTHKIGNAIEVIPFEVAKSKELSRVYLEMYGLDSFVRDDAMNKTQEKIKASSKGGKFSVKIDKSQETAMVEETKLVLITSHIMERLQLVDNMINYVPLSNDPKVQIVIDCPTSLVPVPVVRRRRTTTEDIANKLQDLAMDQAALAAATGKAQKMAALMTSATGGFQEALKHKKEAEKNMTRYQRLWKWACHRIVLQNAVESYTRQWEAWEARQKLKAMESPGKRSKEAP